MALLTTRAFGFNKKGISVKRSAWRRLPAPWLPNVKGMRYVRDQGRKGIVSKLVPR